MNRWGVVIAAVACGAPQPPEVDGPVDGPGPVDTVPIDPEPVDTVVEDTPETDVPPVTDPAPTFPQHRLVGVAREAFCGEATPCAVARRIYGSPVQEQPAACVGGDQYAPGELGPEVLVCFIDYLRDGAHGVVAVLDPRTATWSDLPGGPTDFVSAGLLETVGQSSVYAMLFARLDPDRPDVSLIARSPFGQVFRRGADGRWRVDEDFRAAWEGAGMRYTSESLVADLDHNGLPDVLQMRCADDACQPVAFFQTSPRRWRASENFARMPGMSADAYAWAAIPDVATGGWTIAAAGGFTALGRGSSNLFLQDPAPGADGFPAWTETPGTDVLGIAGMGVTTLDLRGVDASGSSTPEPDGHPEFIASTTAQCPEVLSELLPGVWFNLTQSYSAWIDQPGRRVAGCWWDPTPESEDLAWGIGLVTDDLLLVAHGDDGRAKALGVGTCPECPQGGEPMVGYMPFEGKLWAYPPGTLTFVDSSGADLTFGNRRTLEVHHVPGVDGVVRTVVVTGGVFDEGWPEVWLVDP